MPCAITAKCQYMYSMETVRQLFLSLQSKLHELVVVRWHNVLRALACGGYVNKSFLPGISG